MTTALTLPEGFGVIERRITEQLDQFRDLAQRTVRQAWYIGETLHEAKGLLDHGQWLPFLDAYSISHDIAKRFLKLHREYPDFNLIAHYDSVEAALKAIPKEVKPPSDPPKPPGDDPSDPSTPEEITVDPKTDLTKDEKIMLQIEEKDRQIDFLTGENNDLTMKLDVAEKQVEAIEVDERPQLAGGVQQIAELKNELLQVKHEREKAFTEIKENKKMIATLKRKVSNLEKLV